MILIRIIGTFVIANLLVFFVTSHEVKAEIRAGIECSGTIKAWKYDVSLSNYMATHDCYCPNENALPVCTKNSISTVPNGGYSGGTQNIQMQLMQSMLQPLFNSLFAPPDTSYQDEIARQNAIKQRQEEEKIKQAAIQAWSDLQKEEVLKREMEKSARIKQGEKLLSQMQTVGSAGKLEPFSIGGDPKLSIKSLSQNTYPTDHLTEWQRLLTAAYFSNLAKKSTNNLDGSFYADQAQRVMSGEPTYLEFRVPVADNEKVSIRMEEVKKVYEAMDVKIRDLHGIEENLFMARNKIRDAEARKKEAVTKINELQNNVSAAKPDEKNNVDDELAAAQKLLQDADQELEQAKESEKEALNKKEQLENELGNMRSLANAKIQAGGE